jgi:hypothetical protein
MPELASVRVVATSNISAIDGGAEYFATVFPDTAVFLEMPLNTSQQFRYRYGSAPTSGTHIDVLGYIERR